MTVGKWGRRSSEFSLTGAHTWTSERRAGVVDCRPLPAQAACLFHMLLTLLTDHTAFSYPKALDIDMGTPVLSLPEIITNVVTECSAIVGMLAVPGGEPGVWHTESALFPSFCLPVLYSGIHPALSGTLWHQLLVIPQCTSHSLTLLSWLPPRTAEVSPPEIFYS